MWTLFFAVIGVLAIVAVLRLAVRLAEAAIFVAAVLGTLTDKDMNRIEGGEASESEEAKETSEAD